MCVGVLKVGIAEEGLHQLGERWLCNMVFLCNDFSLIPASIKAFGSAMMLPYEHTKLLY